jgi:predicted nucleic acid-binding protein
MSKLRVYWDSCAWLGLINEEEDKWPGCEYIISQAFKGNVEILVSTLTLAEVFKTKCDAPYKSLAEERDIIIEDFFDQNFIVIASVDEEVAKKARACLRYFGDKGLKKPQDAIHLATALLYGAEQLHTFDGSDLLCLNGIVTRDDGRQLIITKPPEEPEEELYKTSLLKMTETEDVSE